ncbi:hypothetical protein VTJ04DRAFT_10405 [Mycothermus thermophilus]|uniref:uncharacterized protein n=1 Tax=Humicola insolens TaxID=85995 RepID=UPI0037425184
MKAPTSLTRPLTTRATLTRRVPLPRATHFRTVTSGRPYGMGPDEPWADKTEAKEYPEPGQEVNKNYMYMAGGVLGLGALYALFRSRRETKRAKGVDAEGSPSAAAR